MIKRRNQSSLRTEPIYFNYPRCKRRIDKNAKEFKEREIIHGNTTISLESLP